MTRKEHKEQLKASVEELKEATLDAMKTPSLDGNDRKFLHNVLKAIETFENAENNRSSDQSR